MNIQKQKKELGAQRLERITELVRRSRVARVDELAAKMSVSAATIRRDLVEMERRGLIARVHGGAVAVGGRLDEPLFEDKTMLAANEKQRIAQAALDFIKPRNTIFLDGGSTVLVLANLLQQHKNITVVTNSLRVAGTLSGAGPRVIVIGGELRRLSQTFVGTLTRHTIEQITVDVAFMGTIGISTEDGITTTDPREAYTKELVLNHARQKVLLADSSKIGKTSFVRVAPVNGIDTLITDKKIDAEYLKAFKKAGITIITV